MLKESTINLITMISKRKLIMSFLILVILVARIPPVTGQVIISDYQARQCLEAKDRADILAEHLVNSEAVVLEQDITIGKYESMVSGFKEVVKNDSTIKVNLQTVIDFREGQNKNLKKKLRKSNTGITVLKIIAIIELGIIASLSL